MVTRRLQAERRTGSVRRPKTGVLPTVLRNQPNAKQQEKEKEEEEEEDDEEEEKLEKVAIIAMHCHLRPPDAIAFPI